MTHVSVCVIILKMLTLVNNFGKSHTYFEMCQGIEKEGDSEMYSGTNPSALRSREWLRQAMLALLEEEEYTQITIKKICARADLSRQTFYQIFDNKEEILAYHFAVLFEEFTSKLPQEVHQSRLLFDRFFAFFHEQKDFITVLTSNNLTYLLENRIEDYLLKIELFRHTAQTVGNADYLSAYMAGALTRVLLHWAENNYDLPALALSKFVWQAGRGDFHPSPDTEK